jgi:hypothetical protein
MVDSLVKGKAKKAELRSTSAHVKLIPLKGGLN